MTGRDASALYHAAILAEAGAAIGAGRLEHPDATATVDNPLCGDRVTVDLVLRRGTVAALAHRVRGCVLCEAAASQIGRHAPGACAAALPAVERDVEALLAGELEPSALAWPSLEMFSPVRAHRSRHDCVLLAFRALSRATLDAV